MAGGGSAFVYRWGHVYSNSSIFPTFGLPEVCATVPCHASELPFVFHQLPSFTTFTPAEDALSASMAHYWAAFVKGGDPNSGGGGGVAWPAWDPVARAGLLLNDTTVAEDSVEVCNFWDGISHGYLY